MSESTNAIGFADLKQEVAVQLGYGADSTKWTVDKEAHVESRVNSGVRRVYFSSSHDWSWMKQVLTLAFEDGEWQYDLPDDFGAMESRSLYYASASNQSPARQVSVGDILTLRTVGDVSGYPQYFAIRNKETDGSTGSRQEILVYPTPNADIAAEGTYFVYTGKLSDAYPYPAGGAELSELYIESCLSVVEQKDERAAGEHTRLYQELLAVAIINDLKKRPSNYGNMGNRHIAYSDNGRGNTGSYDITYNDIPLE